MLPILRQTLANYASFGGPNGFSGPIVRGDIDTVKRAEELGVTTIWAPPLAPPLPAGAAARGQATVGAQASNVDEKKRAMERYARDVIERVG